MFACRSSSILDARFVGDGLVRARRCLGSVVICVRRWDGVRTFMCKWHAHPVQCLPAVQSCRTLPMQPLGRLDTRMQPDALDGLQRRVFRHPVLRDVFLSSVPHRQPGLRLRS